MTPGFWHVVSFRRSSQAVSVVLLASACAFSVSSPTGREEPPASNGVPEGGTVTRAASATQGTQSDLKPEALAEHPLKMATFTLAGLGNDTLLPPDHKEEAVARTDPAEVLRTGPEEEVVVKSDPKEPAVVEPDPKEAAAVELAPKEEGVDDAVSPPGTELHVDAPANVEAKALGGEIVGSPIRSDAPTADEVSQYLWSVYQRPGAKFDYHGDFSWKDVAAAERLGISVEDYVIGGMDPDFREQLYASGKAMDAAGINWTILSAFRDDYRQELAVGYKAHVGNSFHGGSAATGGYGHGCAVDLANVDRLSNSLVWNWLDQHGSQYGLYRPLRASDPAHVQPRGPWHALGATLREERHSPALGDGVPVFAASAGLSADAGLSEEQVNCVRPVVQPGQVRCPTQVVDDPACRPSPAPIARDKHLKDNWANAHAAVAAAVQGVKSKSRPSSDGDGRHAKTHVERHHAHPTAGKGHVAAL